MYQVFFSVRVCRTRSVVVEFSLYNINTNLLAVFSFLMEFPVSDRALSSLDLHVITLWPFAGLDLQLLLTVTPPLTHPTASASATGAPHFVSSCPPDRPPRSGFIFPGARRHLFPEGRLWLLAVGLESPGHLQIGSGCIRVRAPPEPLHDGHAAVDAVLEASAP